MTTTVAGLILQNPLMNAAYIGSKTTGDIQKLINAASGAVVVGSITVQPRTKNPGPGYWRHTDGLYSLNSYGMPNGGIDYFAARLLTIVDQAHAKHKPLLVNVAGFSCEEFIQLIELAQQAGADMVELNLGCPNVWHDGQQKSIWSYHPGLVEELLEAIRTYNPTIQIAVKISPLPPELLREIANVLSKSKVVAAVVATNSYPNAAISTDTRFADEDGLSGMSGSALKPISLGVVKQLHSLLPDNIAIIGCGGIATIRDVDDYLAAGAQAVQIATALIDAGPQLFETLVKSAR